MGRVILVHVLAKCYVRNVNSNKRWRNNQPNTALAGSIWWILVLALLELIVDIVVVGVQEYVRTKLKTITSCDCLTCYRYCSSILTVCRQSWYTVAGDFDSFSGRLMNMLLVTMWLCRWTTFMSFSSLGTTPVLLSAYQTWCRTLKKWCVDQPPLCTTTQPSAWGTSTCTGQPCLRVQQWCRYCSCCTNGIPQTAMSSSSAGSEGCLQWLV